MSDRRHASFDRDPGQVRRAALWVEKSAGELGLGDRDRKRMALVVEELFANTLQHGGPATGSRNGVEIRLGREDGAVRMDYRDPGKAFNPLAIDVPPPAKTDDWPIGGTGLRLIQGLATHAAYSFEDGVNVVSLWMRPS